MFSAVRRRFTWQNAAIVLTLVFAMSGGAYAAGKYLLTSTKQISPKVLKQLKGKAGPTGPQGKSGANGAAGLQGKEGPAGKEGPEGKAGANGVSVTSAAVLTSSATCGKLGGSEFTAAEGKKTTACNGKAGQPWTYGGTLPEGSSERGQWVITGSGTAFLSTSISFPIPLASPLPAASVHMIGYEEGAGELHPSSAITSGECTGNWQSPGARSKNLCVFTAAEGSTSNLSLIENAETGAGPEAGVSGAILSAGVGSGLFVLKGSWVVTG